MITDPLTRCYSTTVAILLAGLGTAVTIYLTAGEAPIDPFAEFERSKKFTYELERMGGKGAVLANDFNRWFVGLWQGESLSYTVAGITIAIAALYYFIATGLVTDAQRIENDQQQ